MSDICVEAIQKAFKGQPVLRSLSLEVKDRELCVLLGPSGCGKTTLLRIIAGLEAADGGSVSIGGSRVDRLPPQRRNLAMVFQNYAVFPHMTIRENIAFGLRMKKAAGDLTEKRVQSAAEMMQIGNLLDRYPGQLSGGQRQRVAVARSLAVEPDVLLMDEPLSNLDALLRLEMRSELKALLKERGVTTIYVTHDQTEALSLADRIAVMHSGGIEQYDRPERIYRYPATVMVGGFIGTPPMNFVSDPALFAGLGASPPDGAVKLGIRPEDLQIDATGLRTRALVVEMLGASLQITARLGDGLIRVSVPAGSPVLSGQEFGLRADGDKCRWYDAGDRLMGEGGPKE
ncbi:MAG: ABC transporter ATP-binding protein [Thermodesulfobacteriota bacterium]